jgi:hypothetical protein
VSCSEAERILRARYGDGLVGGASDLLLKIQYAIKAVPFSPAREIEAAHAAMDAKERSLDEHGYGGKQVDPSQIVGIAGYIPALRLYSDELGALRRLRDMALALTPYADDVQVESHFPDLADRLRSLTELARTVGGK